MMIPIYICDDEILLMDQVKQLVSDQVLIASYDMGPIQTFQTPEQLLNQIREGCNRGIYFLDIDFPGHINGFELAKEIRLLDPRGFIIFITGHDDLATETFRYQLEAMDYIVKGDEGHLKGRIQNVLANARQRILAEPKESNHYYPLKMADTIRHIPLSQILYFEAVGGKHLVIIRLMDETVEFYGSLTSIEKELETCFWRCHRGYLVNREHIQQIHLKENVIELTTGERCLLSRRAKKEVLKDLQNRA